MWSLWTMEPSQSPPSCSMWGGIAEASTAAEERAEEERGGEALTRERARQEDGWKQEERARTCRPPPPPTFSLAQLKRSNVGGRRGINCAHSPMSRDYCALMAEKTRRGKASGPCGPRKIRARTKASEWRARACGGVPSHAYVGRISSPRGPRSRLRETDLFRRRCARAKPAPRDRKLT